MNAIQLLRGVLAAAEPQPQAPRNSTDRWLRLQEQLRQAVARKGSVTFTVGSSRVVLAPAFAKVIGAGIHNNQLPGGHVDTVLAFKSADDHGTVDAYLVLQSQDNHPMRGERFRMDPHPQSVPEILTGIRKLVPEIIAWVRQQHVDGNS